MGTVALYARTSTDRQSKGLESQILALSKYCKDHNLTDFENYSDNGVSGTKEHRPELDRLMRDVVSGKVKTVVVFSFSRMGRSTQHLLKVLNFFQEKSINFISLSESLDTTTAVGKCLFGIISSISQMERDLISERVKSGLENAKFKGKILGAPKTINSELIIELLKQKRHSYSQIARLVKCSKSSVGKIQMTLRERPINP